MIDLLVVHAAATWFMVGLIWTIQWVHYPLFARVGSEAFVAYEAEHTRRMGALLAIPATLEIACAAWLAASTAPGVSGTLAWTGGLLLVGIWVMTATVQVPLHRRLSAAYDDESARRLAVSNRWRTAAWSARGLLAAAMVAV